MPSLHEVRLLGAIHSRAKLTGEWIYLDDASLEAFRVLAYQNPEEGRTVLQTIWPESPDQDSWRMDEPPGPWPLYRLPELGFFGRVYLCQSERSADAARWAGLSATTSAGGCHALHKTDFSPLSARDVVILLDDADSESARIYARAAAATLDRLMPSATDVRVLELPPPNNNICSFLEARAAWPPGLPATEINSLADRAPHWSAWSVRHPGSTDYHAAEPPPARVSDIATTATEWLWPGRIAVGELTLLIGVHSGPDLFLPRPVLRERVGLRVFSSDFGNLDNLTPDDLIVPAPSANSIDQLLASAGAYTSNDCGILPDESLLALDIAARITTGAPWPDCAAPAPRGSVLLLNTRAAHSDALGPWLARAGADPSRIISPGHPRRTTAGRRHLATLAALERAIQQARQAQGGDTIRMILIDPLSPQHRLSPDVLESLTRLAAAHRIALVIPRHLAGKPGSLSRLHALAGPALQSARSAWLTLPAPSPEHPDRRLFLPAASPPAAAQTALAYHIAGAKVHWESAPVALQADAVLRAQRKAPGPPPAAQQTAAEWLRRRLARGPARAGHVRRPGTVSLRQEAKEAGFSWSTVRRAMLEIGAVKERCPVAGKFLWRMR